MKMCAICVISSEYACSCCGQMFHYFGIENGSPALASAMIDLTPGFTFILAIIFRWPILPQLKVLSFILFSRRAKFHFIVYNYYYWMTRLVLRESNLTTKIKVLTFILQFGLVAFPFHSPKMIIISDALFSLCNQYHQTYRNKYY